MYTFVYTIRCEFYILQFISASRRIDAAMGRGDMEAKKVATLAGLMEDQS